VIKHKLECAYIITKFDKHEDLKYEILKLIENTPANHILAATAEVNISKTDWEFSQDPQRKWVNYLYSELMEHMLISYKELGYDSFTVGEIWFQQYYQNSQHGWHIHARNFTNIYYLEFPAGSPKTELIIPYDQSTRITLDAVEGDTVIFPSFALHQAPINTIEHRKTIISFNTDIGYSDELYQENLKKYAII
jgi:hypothetical protein